MTFSDFCEKMLIALYQDGHQSSAWLSFLDLQKRYGLVADASWLSRAMNHLSAQRRVEGREINGSPDSVVGRITGSGMVYIEAKYGSKDGVGKILEHVTSPEPVSNRGNTKRQVILNDTVEAEIVPASNRLVRLDHNQPIIQQAVSDAKRLATNLASSNDVGSLTPEGRQVAIEETEEIASALTRPAVRMPSFGDRVRSTLSWIGSEAAGALVGAAALALLAILAHILGFAV